MLSEAMVERLRRLEWIFDRTPVYFVTACTANRRKLLTSPDVHQRLIQFGEDGPAYGAWLGAYVLMPDHLHAFVALDTLVESGIVPSGEDSDSSGPSRTGGSSGLDAFAEEYALDCVAGTKCRWAALAQRVL